MNIEQALAEVIKSHGIIKFVDIGASSLNKGVLQTEKLAAFIQEMKSATTLLDAARLIPMNSFSKDIDIISMDIDLEAPTRNASTGAETLTSQDPTFDLQNLTAVKLRAKTSMTSEALEDSIEQGNLAGTVTSLFGAAAGRSFERIAIYGDTEEVGGDTPSGYKAIDGWIKKATNVLYGTGASKDFDQALVDSSTEKYPFAVMLDAQDTNYLNNAAFFVPTVRARNYQRSLKARDTNLGDQANLQNGNLTFEGYPVVAVPGLDVPVKDNTFFGPEAMFFGPAEQFVYGLWKTVTIRPFEDIPNDMYSWYMRMRGDVNFEQKGKVVCALPGETK